jgi:anaerobic ribonucleoside-triphosphate reductase
MRNIRKRDGRVVEFDSSRIANAIGKAFKALGIEDNRAVLELAAKVTGIAEQRFSSAIPGVEEIQNLVEEVLIDAGYAEVAKAYRSIWALPTT